MSYLKSCLLHSYHILVKKIKGNFWFPRLADTNGQNYKRGCTTSEPFDKILMNQTDNLIIHDPVDIGSGSIFLGVVSFTQNYIIFFLSPIITALLKQITS